MSPLILTLGKSLGARGPLLARAVPVCCLSGRDEAVSVKPVRGGGESRDVDTNLVSASD